VPMLLAAAGFGGNPPFVEVGQCQVWAGAPQDGIDSAITPAEAAPFISAALQGALASLGVPSQSCALTSDPDEAHVLVWVAYGDSPELSIRPQSTFLGSSSSPPVSGPPGSGQSASPGAPIPGTTGNAGLGPSTGGATLIALLSAACAALLLGARSVTRRV
jgi:hypothetical protein